MDTMTSWVRVDTRFISHPKVLDIGPLGEALWLRGLCYAGSQMTDGFIPASFIKRMGDMKGAAVAQRLVDAGLWVEAENGYHIHDYLEWQRSRDEATDISSKRAEAGRRGGQQKASNLLAKGQQTSSNALPDKSREDKTRTEQRREEETGDGANAPTPPRPADPPQPAQNVTPIRGPHKLPDDFEPDETAHALADELGLRADFDFLLGQFRDRQKSSGKRQLDWQATFRNWLRKEIEFRARDRASPRAAVVNGKPTHVDRMIDYLAYAANDTEP
jgi:hypothetical protein